MVIIGVLIMGNPAEWYDNAGNQRIRTEVRRGMVLIAAVAFDSFIKSRRAKEVNA